MHRGTLVTWSDPRFAPQAGPAGMWTPLEAYKEYGAGVFFFEPYDPARIPVLFVHGINGTANDFKTIIDNLDRTRFQPWVFQYPSGFRLELISDFLLRTLDELQAIHKFNRYAIIAHSMGGLVSRATVNKTVKRPGTSPIVLYVTISTPWEGHEAAKAGAQYSPLVLPVWLDMVPGSPYLSRLWQTELPATVPYYLIYGYKGGSGTDGTVSLRSVLKLEAQDQSVRTIGFPNDHTDILQSSEVIHRLNALLARYAPSMTR
jgi:pimeloyl-ACP methyl ester carboxylesterase